jgi:hypothetical protein
MVTLFFVHRRRALQYTTVIPHINQQPVPLPPTRASMPIDFTSGHGCQWLSLFMNRSTMWRCRYSHESESYYMYLYRCTR